MRRAAAIAACAGAVAGLAWWCSTGALDRVDAVAGPIRVAMLPAPWLAVLLALAGAAAVLAGVALMSRVRTGRWDAIDAADADAFLPLFGSGVLALPYLPWLADWMPAWTVLAGPIVPLVWFVVGALVVRAVAIRTMAAGRWPPPRLRAATLMVVGVSALFYGAVAMRFAGTALYPGGDEPHYLVISQSLWRDGDLKIENNHRRGDTLEYFSRALSPHYLTRGVDREIYSVHPIGLPVILAPILALGGYPLVVVFMVLIAVIAATVAWWIAARVVDGRAATFGWMACAMTAAWVFNTFTVYPEVPAGLCVLMAFALALGFGDVATRRRLVLRAASCGLAIALLPWLSSKYGAMAAALSAIIMLRLWLPGDGRWLVGAGGASSLRDRLWASVAFGVPCAISAVSLLAFFWIIWGKPAPSAPYGGMNSMDLSFLAAGGLGLLFDQEYGVVAVAPVLLLSLFGLAGMLRQGGSDRRVAAEIALVFGTLLLTVGAFRLWWGGSASPGRPVVSGLLLLVVPCAWQMRAWRHAPALRAAAWTLLFTSLAMTATLAWAQRGLLTITEKDGSSRLLAWWSPSWSFTSLGPTFILQPPVIAGLVAAVWLAVAIAALAALRAMPRAWSAGRAGLAAVLVPFIALSGGAAVIGSWSPHCGVERTLSARPRSPLLDNFDARQRPLALVYDPLRRIPPSDAPALVRLVSGPDESRDLAVPALLNSARWVLPAGTYDVQLSKRDGPLPSGGQVALQVGRHGPSLMTWTMAGAADTWQAVFSLPIDVSFVGLKVSPDVAAQHPSIAIRPRRVRDRSTRLPELEVLHTRRYDNKVVLFHDTNVDAERKGFWTRRDTSTRITVEAEDATSTRLRFRAGPLATSVAVHTAKSSETLTLQPNEPREVTLERSGSPWRVELDTSGGFVPAEVDPANGDRRALGCWVEIMHGS